MMSGTADDDTIKNVSTSGLREDLINKAVNFLQNRNVQKSSLTHQQAFLKSKGLSDEEVRIACERSAALTAHKNQQFQSFPQFPPAPINTQVIAPQSGWSQFRDIINTIAIISGFTYGLYLLYKKYIAPLLFGGKKKRKSLEESMSDLDRVVTSSVQELRDGLNKVHVDLEMLKGQEQKQQRQATARQLEDLKADIASVKGLLLNRNQFAPPVSKTPLVPPSIPDWQLTASEAAKEGEDEGTQNNKVDADIEEICTSGSGSSETEVVTRNGSDSSLEMIRE